MVGLALVALLAAACSDPEDQDVDPEPGGGTSLPEDVATTLPPEPGPAPGGSITVGVDEDPTGLSPAAGRWTLSQRQLATAVFDTLTAIDEHGDVRPFLAEAVTSEDDHRRWTIHLRPDVTMHDGTALTAAVVRSQLEALRAAPLPAPLLAPIASVEATGDLEVVVTAEEPWATFPDVLATEVGAVTDPAWLAGGDPHRPIGTGPFRVVSWEPGREVVVERNPDYWRTDVDGQRLPYLDDVRFAVVPDDGARVAKLGAGELDLITTTSAHDLEQLTELTADEEAARLQVLAAPETETAETFVALNTAAPPFDRADARQALTYATDAEGVAGTIHADLVATGAPFGPGNPWAPDTFEVPFDGPAADALLAEGVTDDGEPLAFTILGTEDPRALATLRLLEERWRERGLQPRLELVAPAELRRRARTGEYEALLTTQVDDSLPIDDLPDWHPAGAAPIGTIGPNIARYADPVVGSWLDAWAATDDMGERQSLLTSIRTALAADTPYVWLFHAPVAVAASLEVADLGEATLPDGDVALAVRGGAVPLAELWWRPVPPEADAED